MNQLKSTNLKKSKWLSVRNCLADVQTKVYDYNGDKAAHKSPDSGKCGLNNPLDIICYCQHQGYTRKICKQLPRGPLVFTADANTLGLFRLGWQKYVSPTVTFSNGDISEQPILNAGWIAQGFDDLYAEQCLREHGELNIEDFREQLRRR